MEVFLLILVPFAASLLTFFTGFGLGTLLMPVLAFFFPPEEAIAITGIVHFLNNLLKAGLMFRYIDLKNWILFCLGAFPAAALGAWLLIQLGKHPHPLEFKLFSVSFQTSVLKVSIGSAILFFSLMEFMGGLKSWQISSRWMPLGGFLSGFFGGFSGNQGALRTLFLIKSGLSKEAFIATGVAIALLVDLTRLSIYFGNPVLPADHALIPLLVATGSALAGTLLGRKILKKIHLGLIHHFVFCLLSIIGIMIVLGLA